MILLAQSTGFTITDGRDFTRLHVDARGLSAENFWELVSDDPTLTADKSRHNVWIDITKLEHGAATDTPSWREKFHDMIKHAASKGWVSDDGRRVCAHVENLT